MKINHMLYLCCVMLLCGCTTYTIKPHNHNELNNEMNYGFFTSTNNITFKYRAYYPSTNKKIPIIFYLHGAGQRGDDNVSQLDVGVGSLVSITTEKEEFKSIIIAPQCPKEYFWRDDVMLDSINQFILYMCSNDYVDKNRVYVTGYSMGGDASWKLAIKYPNNISTIMPICGGPLETMEPDRPFIKKEVSNVNIWAFNNFDDTIVRPNFSKYVFSKLWCYKINDNLNFTENIDGGHDSTNIYRNRKYMIWMLSTKKN